MTVSTGRFIALEGIEGVGKTTQIEFVCNYLERRGFDIVSTREPGGTPIGERLRNILLDPENKGLGIDTELLLMFAARAEHIEKVIRPALQAGKTVITDRFTDASYAYQGGGRGVDVSKIEILEKLVQSRIKPQLVLLLDAPVEQALARTRGRGMKDRFEQETMDFFTRVRNAYLSRAGLNPADHMVIDASQSIADVQGRLSLALDEFLSNESVSVA